MKYADEIHGEIILPTYIHNIVATEEFQRLRKIKQLGGSDFIFPSAIHTRFAHSLGVYHLSDVLLNYLEKEKGFEIDSFHRKCVTIAGLLHDVGHGPYSHLWDKFIQQKVGTEWDHEDISCQIVRKIVNNDIGLNEDIDRSVNLICSLILGNVPDDISNEYTYLFEIINNKYSRIDVDKWDYILRDIYYLPNPGNFPRNFPKFYEGAHVSKDENGKTHICYNQIDENLIAELFNSRSKLHKDFYQNEKVAIIDQMIVNALIYAEKSGFLFKGEKLSKAHLNFNVYKHLDDTIIEMILQSNDSKLKDAQEIFTRIRTRNIYKIIDEGKLKELQSNGKDVKVIHQKLPIADGNIPQNIFVPTNESASVEKRKRREIYYTTEYNKL